MNYWLTQVPSHWAVRSLRYCCTVGTGERDTIDAVEDGPVPFYVRSPNVERIDTPTHVGEAVLTPGDGAVGEVFHHHRGGPFAAHQRVYVLRDFRPDVDVRFFFWYFSSTFRLVTDQGTAKSTVDSLRRPMFTSFPVTVPPLPEQRAIADYLDRETALIDQLIEKQNTLIEQLRERRARTVRDAMQGRFTSRAAVRSRNEVHPWLGEFPRDWRLEPLWAMYRREKRTGFVDEPMVSVFRDLGVVFKEDHNNLNVTAEDRSIYQLVEPGWFVVNRMKAWQGSVGVSEIRGISSGHYLCFRPLHKEEHRFLNWLFRSPQYKDGFGLHSRGVRPGQAEIDNQLLRKLPVLLPPLGEQRAIADYLDGEITKINELIAKAARHIELAKERRSALITAAVTGQIDVGAA